MLKWDRENLLHKSILFPETVLFYIMRILHCTLDSKEPIIWNE